MRSPLSTKWLRPTPAPRYQPSSAVAARAPAANSESATAQPVTLATTHRDFTLAPWENIAPPYINARRARDEKTEIGIGAAGLNSQLAAAWIHNSSRWPFRRRARPSADLAASRASLHCVTARAAQARAAPLTTPHKIAIAKQKRLP